MAMCYCYGDVLLLWRCVTVMGKCYCNGDVTVMVMCYLHLYQTSTRTGAICKYNFSCIPKNLIKNVPNF